MSDIKLKVLKILSGMSAVVIILSSLTACAPKPESVFKDEAEQWFSGFEETQAALKAEKNYEYSEKGSVAVSKPKVSAVDADSAISEYYDTLKNEFRLRASTKEDKLLISYKSYKASDDITGVEVIYSQVLGGETSSAVKTFNFEASGLLQVDDVLQRLTMINAKEMLLANEQYGSAIDKSKLNESRDYQLLFTESGISVIYDADAVASGNVEAKELRADVPYVKVRYALPESIKKNVPEDDSVRTVDITKKLVALTFDDGPNRKYTNEILDTLEAYDSVATFFEVGNVIPNAPEAMKRAAELGCEIGSHSYTHKNLETASVDRIKEEIEKTDAKFEEVLGYKPTMLRPPYGAVDSDLRENCNEYLIGWSVDTEDWKYRDKDKVVASVKNEGDLDGDVILMHSLYESTADAVKELVPWLIENGYQLVTVSELMKYKYETELETGKYYSGSWFDSNK